MKMLKKIAIGILICLTPVIVCIIMYSLFFNPYLYIDAYSVFYEPTMLDRCCPFIGLLWTLSILYLLFDWATLKN